MTNITNLLKRNSKDITLGFLLVTLGITTRTVFHIAPNVEFVTAAALAAGYFFKNKYLSFAVPAGIMMSTDFMIGNSSIYLFTWSSFFLSPLIGALINKIQQYIKSSSKLFSLALSSEASGVLFTLVFFFWTNFGVVVLSNMYSKDLNGLMLSYINGLPFLWNQLVGNLVIVPLVFAMIYLVENKLSGFEIKRKSSYLAEA